MSSAAAAGAAGTSPIKQGNGTGSKRPHEEQPLDTPADGNGTGPPASKTSKPNSSEDDNRKDEAQPTPASSGGGGVVVPVKAEGAQPTDSERVEAECLRSLGLAVGTRLEVMWLLEDDDKSVEKVIFRRCAGSMFTAWLFLAVCSPSRGS